MEFKIRIRGVNFCGEILFPRHIKAYVVVVIPENEKDISFMYKIAKSLKKSGIATVMCNLHTEKDKFLDCEERNELTMERFISLSKWCRSYPALKDIKQGYLGFDCGAGIVLMAAEYWGTAIGAVVTIDGNPKSALNELDLIESPTLQLITEGGDDFISINKMSLQKLGCIKKMEILPDAEKICIAVLNWFDKFLVSSI